jgi:hypothetical protein
MSSASRSISMCAARVGTTPASGATACQEGSGEGGDVEFQMDQERNRQTGESAQQDVLANERVSQSSLEHPVPCDERLRPQSPDVRLTAR